jgi:hypothetical protein
VAGYTRHYWSPQVIVSVAYSLIRRPYKEYPPKCAWVSLSFLCTSETTSCKQRHGGSAKN